MLISNKIIPICALEDNYIWLFFDAESKDAWIIDPGDAQPVIRVLEENGLHLSGIFLTHHHNDHTGGVKNLLDLYPQIKIYGSHLSKIAFVTDHVRENTKLHCSTMEFRAIEIPGHTLDHTAFYGNGWLFSGDTLFSAGCGRIFEGTPEMMYQSLEKLKMLPAETHVFCGHEYTLANLYFAQHVEPDNAAINLEINRIKELRSHQKPTLPSTLAFEKRFNPFLRCSEPSIIKSVENYAGHALGTPLEVFTKLREWKNNFKYTAI